MSRIPELSEDIPPPPELIEAALDGRLVLFVGNGMSRLLGYPDWSTLADAALDALQENPKKINYFERTQLKTLDPRTKLSIAISLAGDGFRSDIADLLGKQTKTSDIYDSINSFGCPCVTTNYDEHLNPIVIESTGGASAPIPVRRIRSPSTSLSTTALDNPNTVVHLHGSRLEPSGMVLTSKDYLEFYSKESVRSFLKELFSKKAVLFLGYGLGENEILEQVLRSVDKEGGERKRFLLQGFFSGQHALYESLSRYYLDSFNLHVLGYLLDNHGYNCQERILQAWVGRLKFRRPPLTEDLDLMNQILPPP